MDKRLVKFGFIAALGLFAYIFLVALFMLNAEKWFVNMPGIVGVATLLLLFVASAAVSGALVLGKPLLLYLENNKADAIKLFLITLGWLFAFFLLLMASMYFLSI